MLTATLATILAVACAFVMHAAGATIPVNTAASCGLWAGTWFGYALGRGQIVELRR